MVSPSEDCGLDNFFQVWRVDQPPPPGRLAGRRRMVEGQDVYSFSGNSSDFGNRGTLVDGGRLRPKSERTTDPAPDPLALGHDDGRFKNLHGPAEVPSAVIAHQPTRSTLSRLPALRRFLHGGAEKRVHEREAVEDMGGPLVLPKEPFSLIIGTRASIEQQSQDRSGYEVPPVAVPLPMLDPEPSVVPGVGAS